MEKFDKFKHVSLITRWWLQDPELVALLKRDRGYKLPADWIRELEQTKGLISNHGIGEVRDIWLGERSKEAEIFYYSPDKFQESLIADRLINWCFQKGITKIRVKQLDVKEQILTKESIARITSAIRRNNGNTIRSKDTSIFSENGTAISTNGYTVSSTIERELPISTTVPNGNSSELSAPCTTTTKTIPTATSAASEKPASNIIRTKKCNPSRKKKQSTREEQKTS
jgi:hypothetical protein